VTSRTLQGRARLLPAGQHCAAVHLARAPRAGGGANRGGGEAERQAAGGDQGYKRPSLIGVLSADARIFVRTSVKCFDRVAERCEQCNLLYVKQDLHNLCMVRVWVWVVAWDCEIKEWLRQWVVGVGQDAATEYCVIMRTIVTHGNLFFYNS